jgi:hypothetical protein
MVQQEEAVQPIGDQFVAPITPNALKPLLSNEHKERKGLIASEKQTTLKKRKFVEIRGEDLDYRPSCSQVAVRLSSAPPETSLRLFCLGRLKKNIPRESELGLTQPRR